VVGGSPVCARRQVAEGDNERRCCLATLHAVDCALKALIRLLLEAIGKREKIYEL